MIETPSKGGSYIREKNGRLKRVASTAPAPNRDETGTAAASKAALPKTRAKQGLAASDKETSNG